MNADELPEGWCFTKVGDICSKVGSGATPRGGSAAYHTAGVPLIRSMNVRFEGFTPDGLVFLNENQAELLREVTVQANDVLLNITGASIGRVCMAPADMAGARVNQHVCILRIAGVVLPEFLAMYLASPPVQRMIWAEEYGVTRQALTKGQILEFSIPTPPMAEQRRVVEAVERLLEVVASARERLERVPSTMKWYRQSVLAAAATGRLTADWRLTRHGQSEASDGLPSNWRTVRVADVIDGLKYGTSKKSDYSAGGVPVLRIPNIGDGLITHDDIKYAELEVSEFEQLRLRAGDILMIRSNGSVTLLGKTALVRDEEHDYAYAGYLIRLRPKLSEIRPEYLNAVLASREVRDQIEIPARSTSGVNNINSDEVRALELVLPPLEEQDEVVRCVTMFFALAKSIDERSNAALRRVELLAQAVLTKAFRGELVPTEAELARKEGRNYEPANVLVARLKASVNGKVKRPRAKKASKRSSDPDDGMLEVVDG